MIEYNRIIENDFEKPIYEKLHIKVLEFLKIHNHCSFWDIIHFVGGSERRMIRLLDQMNKNDEINIKNDTISIACGKKYDCICPKCNGKMVVDDDFKNLKIQFESIYKNKPNPSFIFDQRPTTYATTINRVIYMLNRGDINNKDIVVLGDDDLTGIAIALTGLASSVVVLDIDKRLIDFTNHISRELNLNISAKVYDATKPPPKEMNNKFDTLITDPTPEPIPFSVFTNTAIKLTKPKSSLYFSIYSSAMDFEYAMQEVMTERKLHITDMIPNWTEYKNIKALYRESDVELFKKYNIQTDDKICFTETFIRTIKTKMTHAKHVNYTQSELLGKATKRVLNDEKNDVECTSEDNYLSDCLKALKEKSK